MSYLLSEAGLALTLLLQPAVLLYLVAGVVVGMVLGIIPGFSGITGMVLLLPFVFQVEPAEGLALLLGMYVATTVTDVIPAILVGVPGTASAQAIVVDGYPMAKQGLANRALSAAYASDILGTVVGVLLFFLLYPVLTAIALAFGSPEYLALGFMGVCMIGMMSSRRDEAVRGIIVGLFGLLLATIGFSVHTGLPRYTFELGYLRDGLHIVPVVLGLFALPEIIEMYARNTPISRVRSTNAGRGGTTQGVLDAVANWLHLVWASLIGAIIGILPALGGPVAQWIAYGFAKRTVRDSSRFGSGDVRGLMAAQAAVASNKPGALIPTLVFGVPGDVVMALLMGAFLILGIRPGPEMVSTNLHLTLMMMWIVILGNVVAVAISLCLGKAVLQITQVPPKVLAPFLLAFMTMGSLVATGAFGDIIVFFAFGILGYVMERTGWPRIPMILGFVLSSVLETYLFISYDAFGITFLTRPVVLIVLFIVVAMLVGPYFGRWLASRRGRKPEPTVRQG